MNNDKHKVILLVEDEAIVAMAEAMTLEKYDYKVITAITGEEAIEIVNSTQKIDIILMDINLGKGIDGPHAAEIMLKNRDILIVFLSSHTEREVVEKTEGITSYGYIVKDSGETVLLASIKMAFRLFEARKKEKEKEEALRESEEQYRTILENIEDGYYDVDIKGNFIHFNDSMCRILGYSHEEMMGMNYRQFTDKENAKNIFKTFNEVYETGKPAKEFDWQLIRKDGMIRNIEASVSLQKNSSGKPIGFQGISRDITERKQAEYLLRSTQQRLNGIISNLYAGVMLVSENGKVEHVNQALCDVLNLSETPAELQGLNSAELIKKVPDAYVSPAEVNARIQEIISQGNPVRNEEFAMRDGRFTIVDYIPLVVDGQRYGRIWHFKDITKQKQLEEFLRQSEERYRTIIEKMEDGYFEIDLGGNFTFVNDAECRYMGYLREELIGMNYRQYADKKNAQKVFKAFNKIYLTGESGRVFDYEVTRKDGIVIYAELSASLIRDSVGKPIGFRGVSRHTTERKQYESKLKKQIQDLNTAKEKIAISEEKYRILVEGTNDVIFSLDENFKFLTVNNAVISHLKIKPEEVRSRYFLDLIHEGSERVSVAKQLVQEKLKLFAMDKNPISFKTDFKVSFTSEPKEMRVYLEYTNIEGRNEIIGKATRVEDDLLLKYIESEKQHLIIENYFITAEDISHRITRNLAKYMDHKKVHILRIALREIIINAIEHGNFNISFEEKSQLIDNDNYFVCLAERQQDMKYRNKRVQIEYSIDPREVIYQITDEGDGFDHKRILQEETVNVTKKMLGHGRGISMAKNCFDEMNYNDKGNHVRLIKYFN